MVTAKGFGVSFLRFGNVLKLMMVKTAHYL